MLLRGRRSHAGGRWLSARVFAWSRLTSESRRLSGARDTAKTRSRVLRTVNGRGGDTQRDRKRVLSLVPVASLLGKILHRLCSPGASERVRCGKASLESRKGILPTRKAVVMETTQ